jgi:hypothetical protein
MPGALVDVEAQVLAVVADDADLVDDGVEVDAERLTAQGRGEGRTLGDRDARRRIDAVDGVVGADTVEVAGLGPEVDPAQGHAGREAADGLDVADPLGIAGVEGQELVLVGGRDQHPIRTRGRITALVRCLCGDRGESENAAQGCAPAEQAGTAHGASWQFGGRPLLRAAAPRGSPPHRPGAQAL